MSNQFVRTERLLGGEGIAKLQSARVAVFGIGGVGGHVAEAFVRSGIGALDIIDNDKICLSNLNRQLIATHSTIGRMKVEAMRERLLDINPDCEVVAHPVFFDKNSANQFDFRRYAYVVDAIDTVSAKILLVEMARDAEVPIISCMGAGNKLDPTRFEVADISETQTCPLARVMRRELGRRGIKNLKVVYSKEQPLAPLSGAMEAEENENSTRRQTPGSIAFVPSVAGLIIAGEVVRRLACASVTLPRQ